LEPKEQTNVEELLAQFRTELIDAVKGGPSRADMRRETRPLKVTMAGLATVVLATCGWGVSQIGDYQTAQREQWLLEAKQAEQEAAMASHLETAHVDPAAFQRVENRLAGVEEKLGLVLEKLHREDPPRRSVR
jgi:hypothetical protein